MVKAAAEIGELTGEDVSYDDFYKVAVVALGRAIRYDFPRYPHLKKASWLKQFIEDLYNNREILDVKVQ